MAWEWFINNWLGILSLIVAGIIAIVTVVTQRFHQKRHQINGLLDAFRILNTRTHRSSRKKVYELYREYKQNNDLRIFDNIEEVEDVRADFDVIGLLVKSRNINEEQFLIEFGPLAYRCWNYLQKHIEAERKKRDFKPFMRNFQWLSDKADKYWAKKGHDLSKTLLYPQENKE